MNTLINWFGVTGVVLIFTAVLFNIGMILYSIFKRL
jgi:hypothetical protein